MKKLNRNFIIWKFETREHTQYTKTRDVFEYFINNKDYDYIGAYGNAARFYEYESVSDLKDYLDAYYYICFDTDTKELFSVNEFDLSEELENE